MAERICVTSLTEEDSYCWGGPELYPDEDGFCR